MNIKNKIRKYKKKIKLYKYDRLTHLKMRYDFDKKLEKSEGKFLYLFDLNCLHEINRNQGFSQGDMQILKLVKIITNEFNSKNVFRIGGDEFAVISKNKINFKNLDIAEYGRGIVKNDVKKSFDRIDKKLINKKVKRI